MENAVNDQVALRPADVAVALQVACAADQTYAQIGNALGTSSSTAHDAIQRLRAAGLIQDDRIRVNRNALFEFLEHGVRYAFPATLQAAAKGIPTAFAGPALASSIVFDHPVVWPAADGTAFGPTITPLLPRIAHLPVRHPELYRLLTLVDAVRIGRSRERALATDLLRSALGVRRRVASVG